MEDLGKLWLLAVAAAAVDTPTPVAEAVADAAAVEVFGTPFGCGKSESSLDDFTVGGKR